MLYVCSQMLEAASEMTYQKGHSQIMLEKSTWLYGLRMP